MKAKPSANLPAMLRAIRAECAKQGIEDDTRRALMMEKAGVSSQRDLNLVGAKAVLDHLRRSGGSTTPAPTKDNEWDWVNKLVDKAKQRRLWKIRRLCIEAGIGEGKQIAYAEGIALQMSGAAASAGPVATPLRMCDADTLLRIIKALAEHLRRNGQDPNHARRAHS
jgi:hypothetical protein